MRMVLNSMRMERLKILKAFLEALRRSTGFNFNVNRFDHRLKLQKLVYIAKSLGVPKLEYDFNLYLRGPYSPELADDYYNLGEGAEISEDEVKAFLSNEAFHRFVELVNGEDGTWLEIAATLIDLKKVVDDLVRRELVEGDKEEILINQTLNRKPFAYRKYVKEVLDKLKLHQAI